MSAKNRRPCRFLNALAAACMATVTATAAAATTASASPAFRWEEVSAGAGKTVEIDKNRIARLKNGQTAAWMRLKLDHPLLDFEQQLRYTAVQALNHYDCVAGHYVTRQRIYLLDGRTVRTEKVNGRPLAVQPDSLDARVLDEVCRPRTVREMEQTAERAATAATTTAQDARPRAMHAEMVSAGESAQPRSMKVADTPAGAQAAETPAAKPRLFDMPLIDKSKAEDPYKGAAPPASPAPPAPAPAAVKPAAKSATAAASAGSATAAARTAPVLPVQVQELSRQERERMLATSGPRKVVAKKKTPETPPAPPPPDFTHVHWGYAGLGAPENWGRIPGNATCGLGNRQSPIDIRGGIKVDLEAIKFDYRPSQFRITDNGHTVQVDVGEGNTLTLTGRTYQLVQFHFHRPSEERVNGKAYDMVAHLVHRDFDNNLAVVAVLMEMGADNPFIQTLWNYMPLEVGMSVEPPDVTIDLNQLLPEKRTYYTYMGSLTTPPCTENVLWMVMKHPVPVSLQQIGIFARLYPHNARPVQPANDRLIKESR